MRTDRLRARWTLERVPEAFSFRFPEFVLEDALEVFANSTRDENSGVEDLTDQIPDDVKQRRVEELMLAQQNVAFKRSRQMIGKTIDVSVTSVLQTTAGKMIFGKWDERGPGRHDAKGASPPSIASLPPTANTAPPAEPEKKPAPPVPDRAAD